MSAATQNQQIFDYSHNINQSDIKDEPEELDSITFEDYKITENYRNFTIKDEPEDYFEIVEVKNVDVNQHVVKIPFSIKTEEDCEEIYTKQLEVFSNDAEIHEFKNGGIKIEKEDEHEFRIESIVLKTASVFKNSYENILEYSKEDANVEKYRIEYESHEKNVEYHDSDSKKHKNCLNLKRSTLESTKRSSQSIDNDCDIHQIIKTESMQHLDPEIITLNIEDIQKLVNHDHNYFNSTNTLKMDIKIEDDVESSESEDVAIQNEVRMLEDIEYKRRNYYTKRRKYLESKSLKKLSTSKNSEKAESTTSEGSKNLNRSKLIESDSNILESTKNTNGMNVSKPESLANLNQKHNLLRKRSQNRQCAKTNIRHLEAPTKLLNQNENSSSSELIETNEIFKTDSGDSMDKDDVVDSKIIESENSLSKRGSNGSFENADNDIESLDEDEDGIQYKEITFEELNSVGIKKRKISSISEESDSSLDEFEENEINSKKFRQSSNKSASIKSESSKNAQKPSKNHQKLSKSIQNPPKHQKPSTNQSDQDDTLKCPSCPMTFEDTLRLNRHKRLHIAPQHQCRNCLRKFKRKSMLKKHFCDIKCPTCQDVCICRMETSNDCIICQKINFRYFVDYKQHMLAQHNEIVVCKICEKNNYTLFRHKQLGHQLVKYFRCDECTSVLKSREQLKYHKETHAKNFKCDKCEKVFSRRYLLRQHELTHENPKTFHCEICDKNFQRKYCLDNHIKVIHSDKKKEESYLKLQREMYGERSKDWLQCDKCLALFRNKHSHQRHIDQAHFNWK